MARVTHRSLVLLALTAVLLTSSCDSESATASTVTQTEERQVDELIVRYELDAPPGVEGGAPWGSQCVSSVYVKRLKRGRWIGSGMRVVRLNPPASPVVARRIAMQIEQCPYIEWVEADTFQFSVSAAR